MSAEKLRDPARAAARFMTTTEVAELCRTSPESVRWWRHIGKGPKSFRVGRRVLYETTDVARWLDDLKDGSESDRGILPERAQQR
jgi:DNA-binding transcriptional MerR regulator